MVGSDIFAVEQHIAASFDAYRVVANPVLRTVLLDVNAIQVDGVNTGVVDFDEFVIAVQLVQTEHTVVNGNCAHFIFHDRGSGHHFTFGYDIETDLRAIR